MIEKLGLIGITMFCNVAYHTPSNSLVNTNLI